MSSHAWFHAFTTEVIMNRDMTANKGSNVCFTKVIKGEIHNLLSLLREIPMYDSRLVTLASTNHTFTFTSPSSPSPFEETNYAGEHPLLSSLRQLSHFLNHYDSVEQVRLAAQLYDSSSSWKPSSPNLCNAEIAATVTMAEIYLDEKQAAAQKTVKSRNESSHLQSRFSSVSFLTPFCTAVSSKDISAIVTGAAISALHKFVLYGFIDSFYVNDAMEGITLIARAIRHCSFTEAEGYMSNPSRRTQTDSRQQRTPTTLKNNSYYKKSEAGYESSTYIQLITDEQVVLKLLSLSALVIRSPVGRRLLDSDVVGIFETILHVAMCKSHKASSLLRTAAGDCLSTFVVIIFGKISFHPSIEKTVAGRHVAEVHHDDVGIMVSDSDSDNSRASDDIWGNSDPSECLFQDNIHLQDVYITSTIDGGKILTTSKKQPQSQEEHGIATNDDDSLRRNNTSILPASTTTSHRGDNLSTTSSCPALSTIMSRIVSLCNPLTNDDERCILGLQLMNIALETASPDQLTQYPEVLLILQNDLCKHLLLLSTTLDFVVLTQTLRVIFNLFNSIKNHLKIQLEVFITSIHLRMLDPTRSGASFSYTQREIALESLLEFCHEPELMMNLFLNYDCDVNCTNLFDSICKALVNIVNEGSDFETNDSHNLMQACDRVINMTNPVPLNTLNHLAAYGLMTIIGSIAKRCPTEYRYDASTRNAKGRQNDIYEEVAYQSARNCNGTIISDESSQFYTADLVQSKMQKERLSIIAEHFNLKSTGKEWIQLAQDWNILPTPITPKAVAAFLFTTSFLDKTQIGLYLSRGPHEKFPFHALVLQEFTALYNFVNLSFSGALRLYLHHFRLPGEAQCIDRLMEAFAKEFFKSSCEVIGSMTSNLNHLEGLVTGDDEQSNIIHHPHLNDNIFLPFKSVDAVFILSFSTIMLNTDLHNSTIPQDRKMTPDQFVKNNRGINDGENFPEQFLLDLYHEIKTHQIQVHQSLDLYRHDHLQIDGLFRQSNLSTALFTSYYDVSSRPSISAGVHERDMFIFISDTVFPTLFISFIRSQDAQFSKKLLRSLKDMALVSVYFAFQEIFDKILSTLLSFSHSYILSTLTPNNSGNERKHTLSSEKYSSKPGILLTKGLSCLDLGLNLSRLSPDMMNQSWAILIDLFLTLRDFNCLPIHICELEDFTDGKHSLPPSQYCLSAHERARLFLSETLDPAKESSKGRFKGSFPSIFHTTMNISAENKQYKCDFLSPVASTDQSTILSIFLSSQVDQILIGKQDQLIVKNSIAALLNVASNVESYDSNDCSGLFEHHAVFALELAYRSLFSNRDHSSQLYSMINAKFEEILCNALIDVDDSEGTVIYPYLLERMIITVLRSCIHMFDDEVMRPILLSSLKMLSIMPISYMREIVNRIGCALATLLRVSTNIILSYNEWLFLGSLLDRISRLSNGDAFIFQGITCCVKDYIISPQGQLLCQENITLLLNLLLNYVDGVYGEVSFLQDAIFNLDGVYFYVVHNNKNSLSFSSGDDLWLQVSKTVWKRVLHDDLFIADGAFCVLRKLLSPTGVSHSEDAWLTILDLLSLRFPSLSNQEIRIKYLELLCTLVVSHVPVLSQLETNHIPLSDIVRSIAKFIRENLRAGRNGAVTPLFEETLHHVSNVIHDFALNHSHGDDEFCGWCVDLLYKELEQVGASGSLFMIIHNTTFNR